MSTALVELNTGQSVSHSEMGRGVFLSAVAGGYALVFFQQIGERQVAITSLVPALSWEEEVVSQVRPATREAVERLWLALEAEQLPLLENAAALTSAKVDLLPHQIVLTYRIANASPRRFLVADSVGLGKTIETALILRELASRGELTRALMVVPAGLVENWRRELNDTFHLDFEVFGSEGDVTDRKTNAFAKHNRLIASIDTLKRPARVKRLLEAPPWDLIVFDEAHHLSAYPSGNKLLEEKLLEIAKALGKVDELGQVAEDLRGQILGQLSERLSYDRLYQDAVRDPTLRRTRQELDVALDNARTARQVVFELFQDLEGFRLDEYKQFDDGGQAMRRLLVFVREGVRQAGGIFEAESSATFKVSLNGDGTLHFTTDREAAKANEALSLLGLEHPFVRRLIDEHRQLGASGRGLVGRLPTLDAHGLVSIWHVSMQGGKSQFYQRIVTIGLNDDGERSRLLERHAGELLQLETISRSRLTAARRVDYVRSTIPDLIRRDLVHAGVLTDEVTFGARLLGWIELT